MSSAAPYERKPRSDTQLAEGCNHILYETLMLFNLGALLDDVDRWDRGWDQKTLYMATVESLLVHRRNLMDFYFPPRNYESKSGHDSKMFAADYCDAWGPERPTGFEREWASISEEIHHMTYLRPVQATSWPYAQMLGEVRELTELFAKSADERRLHPFVREQLRAVLGGTRVAQPLTIPTPRLDLVVNPRDLSGLTPGGSTPTSAVLAN